MAKMNSMFPSKWLTAADLDDADKTLTIADVAQESIGQGEEQELKWVVFFHEYRAGGERGKGLVLNKTNAVSLAGCFGDDTDDWIGHKVVLYPTQVQFSGKMVEAIRVKEKLTKALLKAPARKAPAGKVVTQAEADAATADDGDIPF